MYNKIVDQTQVSVTRKGNNKHLFSNILKNITLILEIIIKLLDIKEQYLLYKHFLSNILNNNTLILKIMLKILKNSTLILMKLKNNN